MRNSDKENLEAVLAQLANRKFCFLVSRGATALYLSYSTVLKLSGKKGDKYRNKIILPSTMCHSPANVAIYAGLEPIFCDVSKFDYTLDPDFLQAILEKNPGVLAVLSVSIFGHAPDMVRISKICSKFNVSLIDDAAQSIGGAAYNVPLGGWGDIGIYSFGHSKIIDVGWGGAILTDNEEIFVECKRKYEDLQEPSRNIFKLRAIYSETYYTIERLTAKEPALVPLFWQFPGIFKDLYIYKEDIPAKKPAEILDEIELLSENLKIRRNNWNNYKENLTDISGIILPEIREGSAPWRFTFRVLNNKRSIIVNELRNRNIDVSTWYPSLSVRFEPNGLLNYSSCNFAEALSGELINLWVEPAKANLNSIHDISILIKKLIQNSGS